MKFRTFAALAFAGALTGCQTGSYSAQNSSPPLSMDPPYTLAQSDIDAVKGGVASSLKDPTSPLFGQMKAVKDSSGVVTVCGYVNAKNSFGGYVGNQPYIGTIIGDQKKKGFVVIGMGGTDIDTQVTFNVCRQKGIAL